MRPIKGKRNALFATILSVFMMCFALLQPVQAAQVPDEVKYVNNFKELEAAVTKAKNKSTIKLKNDLLDNENNYLRTYNMSGKRITIDLQGNTLHLDRSVLIIEDGSVTIKNGVIMSNSKDSAILLNQKFNNANPELFLEDVIVKNTASEDIPLISVVGKNSIVVEEGDTDAGLIDYPDRHFRSVVANGERDIETTTWLILRFFEDIPSIDVNSITLEGAEKVSLTNGMVNDKLVYYLNITGEFKEGDIAKITYDKGNGETETLEATLHVKHEHIPSDTWSFDGSSHWKECSSGDRFKIGEAYPHHFPDIISETKDGWENDESGNKMKRTCPVCGYKETREITDSDYIKPNLGLLNGGDSIFIQGSGIDVTITSNGEYENLTTLKLDNKLLDKAAYTVKKGSTILTLKASYLDTLSLGKHTVTFLYKDNASISATFTIVAKEEPVVPETPKETPVTPKEEPVVKKTASTNTSTLFYMGLVVLGCYVVMMKTKEKKESNK